MLPQELWQSMKYSSFCEQCFSFLTNHSGFQDLQSQVCKRRSGDVGSNKFIWRRSLKIIYARFLHSFLLFGSTLFHACLNIPKVHLSKKRSICILLNSQTASTAVFQQNLVERIFIKRKRGLKGGKEWTI